MLTIVRFWYFRYNQVGICDLIELYLRYAICDGDDCAAISTDHETYQSSETVILGVDTHLDIHVGAVISRRRWLLGTHYSDKSAGYLELPVVRSFQ